MMVKKHIKRILIYPVLTVLCILGVFLIVIGVNAGGMAELQPWHYMSFPPDDLTENDFSSFQEYLSVEKSYLESIYDSLADQSVQDFCKYTRDDIFSPVINGENLNGSFILESRGGDFQGGVLLVHGLSDSPYHMLEIGKSLSEAGFYVIGLRLPGHGTVPAALIDIRWQDWYQAVEFASEFVKEKIREEGQGLFVMGGFSTGAALNLRYTMKSILEGSDVLPDKLLFFSPAIGITPFAELTGWDKIISWMPLFYKMKWQSIDPEYDTYRYTSWPFNAGYQIYKLSRKNWKLLKHISSETETLEKVPSMIAFQSRVDATVLPQKVYELFDRIAPEGSKLFLFDINRKYQGIISSDLLDWSREMIPGNRVSSMIRMMPEDNIWPDNIYAISHLSIPISFEDGVYGEDSLIGALGIKGERGVLDTGIELDRLRYNPFFSQMEAEMLDFVLQ